MKRHFLYWFRFIVLISHKLWDHSKSTYTVFFWGYPSPERTYFLCHSSPPDKLLKFSTSKTHSRSVLRWHFLCLIIAAALGQYLLQSLHMSLVSFPCISRMSWKELRARSWILQFKIYCFTTFIYNNSQNMRLTLVFMWNSAQREKLISIFQEFSSSINKTIILARGLGTRLSFYEV